MSRYFPLHEYQSRWDRVLEVMRAHDFETAVVFGRGGGTTDNCGDILYLSNHYAISGGTDSLIWSARSFSGIILQQGKEPQLHIDEPEVRSDLVSISDAHCSNHPFRSVAKALNDRGITGRVALVGTQFIPMKFYQQLLEEAPGIDWVPADDLVRAARRIKSPLELECYRIGGETATAGLNRLMEGLTSGLSEREAAGEAAREVVRRGGRLQMIGTNHGETLGFDQRFPLTGYSADTPKPGDIVTGTLHGAFYQGYYLDPGRTGVRGRPTADQRRLIEAAANIVHRLSDMMRPGTKLLDVAAEGDRLTAAFGGSVSPIMKNFPFYGHGIGLGFEQPRISTVMSQPDDVVDENMVFGVEAFLSLDGVGAAFFEDILIIGGHENELLTRSPAYWW
ncbi:MULTISPECIES: M24 family metallopeptidase [unclassified Rhizobium]|uniref:M24 family metallopeptidase n=1 Tax=unclassified Rhizobium TaxID=2613769 RepID=UPI001ADD254E|nr:MULTISPECIES: M24 family metallopeptidase [unclassified Rhizobium]MBO9101538.1 aminopeptidase P family protein [Rhizobium sp. L58/93]MBO9187531.1 aminopeptidase P family protein [Rhizobium sp. E27B/91]QXZ86682.1 aminopeptidase P family protein [Rhizobium sp. K1/93]QXZ93285.1 aminopeptidase P family protein [Rhizobium sp. K15/93]